MRKIFSSILLALSWMTCLSQPNVVDSLQKIISKLPDDTVKVNRMNELVGKLQHTDPEKAASVATASVEMAKKINYSLGLATGYRLQGVLCVDRMLLDSGRFFYDKAFALVKDNMDPAFQKQAGLITHNYGAIYHKKQAYDSAVSKYIEAIGIFSKGKNEALIFFPSTNLSTIYSYLKDNKKALYYAREANIAARKLNDPAKIISAVNTEMSVRLEMGQYDSVLSPLRENITLAKSLQNYYQEGNTANLIAKYYGSGRNLHDSSAYWAREALQAMQKAGNEYEGTNMLHNLGYYYKLGGRTDSARKYLKLSLEKGRALQLDYVVQYSLENLIDIEDEQGNIPGAYAYLRELTTLKDSLQVKANQEQVNELEARYQSEKKDIQIKLQKASIQRKNILNVILIGGAAVLLLLLLLIYRTYRQRQKLQQQRISELEKEKQLTATEAVLKGEEQERTRLAKDLHDGLGGMLSGIKYSLNTMKGNLIMTAENQQAFERSMDMLDSSIREMRRVAHNMMPEALVKFGLDTALRDFCNDINQSGALQLNYQSLGMQGLVLDQTLAITVYRVVQELINNTIKHAGAKQAIVQISKSGSQLTVTVEDDGKGFDTKGLNHTGGIGWSNIRNRVDFLKGRLDVDSRPGAGTSVHIELDLP
jgi:two-component system, NarL family, sensor kinase